MNREEILEEQRIFEDEEWERRHEILPHVYQCYLYTRMRRMLRKLHDESNDIMMRYRLRQLYQNLEVEFPKGLEKLLRGPDDLNRRSEQ